MALLVSFELNGLLDDDDLAGIVVEEILRVGLNALPCLVREHVANTRVRRQIQFRDTVVGRLVGISRDGRRVPWTPGSDSAIGACSFSQ